ncbi:RtcB family protein [Vulcanisaeta thermophila]|uniref:RtcB family protein n=1 Tax=Vulcanisaeta thermophila TaxID=867917 RepID=UPI0008530242|nr:RtcB family protein [Vulcanisaeta thermophila]
MAPPLRKISDYVWEIPRDYKPCMKVPARIFADETLIEKMKTDMTLEQAANVACLPGIYKYSIALPDAHQGYGFPVGGVAAMDMEKGVVSPGGIGYDINCGVRLLRTNLTEKDVRPKLRELVDTIFKLVPAGVGETGLLKLSISELDKVLDEGVDWALSKGYGWGDDKNFIEEFGHYEGADSSKVSQRAKERGKDELGTTGSGNHFIEIQVVNKIFDVELAKRLGIEQEGQVMVLIHTGSRGLGHQVATDYIRLAESKMKQWGLFLPDRELASIPLNTKEAQDYLAAMKAAANYAWTNRQIITHWVREAFRRVFNRDPDKLGLTVVYDVAHNIAKIEDHVVDDEGHVRRVLVHRKGATRAFPAGRPEIPPKYRDIGQPVLIPGSMGTASYVLIGLPTSFQVTFGTAPHGAGRTLSRSAAVRMLPPNKVRGALESRGIIVRSAESEIISEEAPEAYKNVDKVAEVAEATGMAKRVSRHVPIGVVKG